MKTYHVWIPSVTWLRYEVEAESEVDAIKKHKNDKSEYADYVDCAVPETIDELKMYAEEES